MVLIGYLTMEQMLVPEPMVSLPLPPSISLSNKSTNRVVFDYTINVSARTNGKFVTTTTINLSNKGPNRLFDYCQIQLEVISLPEIASHIVAWWDM